MKKKIKEMLNGKFWKENVGTKSAGESTPGLQLYLERDFKTDAFLNFAKFLRRTPPVTASGVFRNDDVRICLDALTGWYSV